MQILEHIQGAINESDEFGELRSAMQSRDGKKILKGIAAAKISMDAITFRDEARPYIAGVLRANLRGADLGDFVDALAIAGAILGMRTPKPENVYAFFETYFNVPLSQRKRAGAMLEAGFSELSKRILFGVFPETAYGTTGDAGASKSVLGVINAHIDDAADVDEVYDVVMDENPEWEMGEPEYGIAWRTAISRAYADPEKLVKDHAQEIARILMRRMTGDGDWPTSNADFKRFADKVVAPIMTTYMDPPSMENNHDYFIPVLGGEGLSGGKLQFTINMAFATQLKKFLTGEL